MATQPPCDAQFPNVIKKSFSRKMDFWDGFKPVYYFSRAFGLLPFSIRRDANGEVQEPTVNKIDGVWFLFTIVVFLTASQFSHRYISAFNSSSQMYVSVLLDNFRLVLSLIFGAVMIALDMLNRFKLVKLWKLFIIFDKEVRNTLLNFVSKQLVASCIFHWILT